jgi:peroxin-7
VETPHGPQLELTAQFDSHDGLYDCSWSEENEVHLVAGSGDGSVKIYATDNPGTSSPPSSSLSLVLSFTLPLSSFWFLFLSSCSLLSPLLLLFSSLSENRPLQVYEEHTQEVYSVDWNLVHKNTFLSGAWDESIKLWSPLQRHSLQTFREHSYCIYRFELSYSSPSPSSSPSLTQLHSTFFCSLRPTFTVVFGLQQVAKCSPQCQEIAL